MYLQKILFINDLWIYILFDTFKLEQDMHVNLQIASLIYII